MAKFSSIVFNGAAKAIASAAEWDDADGRTMRRNIAESFANWFAAAQPKFDRDRFLSLCNLGDCRGQPED